MKKFLRKLSSGASLTAAILLAALGAGTACAQNGVLPTYQTLTASNATASMLIFPQTPTSQDRLVSLIYTSDANASSNTIGLLSGITATSVASNDTVVTDTQMQVASTNGITTGSLLYVQGATSNQVVAVTAFNSSSNLSFTPSLGFTQLVNQEVEVLGNAATLQVAPGTNVILASDGLYVGNYGRVLVATNNGATKSKLTGTIHRDAFSQ